MKEKKKSRNRAIAGILTTIMALTVCLGQATFVMAGNVEDVTAKVARIGDDIANLTTEVNKKDPASGVTPNVTNDCKENGVDWKFVMGSDGTITELWSEENSIMNAVDPNNTLIIPAFVKGIPVTGIGGGSGKPVVSSTVSSKDSITGVSLPFSIKKINDNAFATLSGLKSITIPENTAKTEIQIGSNAFKDLASLKTVRIEGAADIKSGAFSGTGVTYLSIAPDSNIEGGAFSGLTALEDLYIPRNTTVKSNAFKDCTTLKLLHTDSYLQENSFDGCNAIEELIIGIPGLNSGFSTKWNGTGTASINRTVYDSSNITFALDKEGEQYYSPFGLAGMNITYQVGHVSNSAAGLQYTYPSLSGNQMQVTNRDIKYICEGTPAEGRDAYITWLKGQANSFNYREEATGNKSISGIGTDNSVSYASRKCPLMKGTSVDTANVVYKSNKSRIDNNGSAEYQVEGKRQVFVFDSDEFCVIRKSDYDNLTEKTKENISAAKVYPRNEDFTTGDSGIIKAVAVAFQEGYKPLATEFDIRIERKTADDFVIGDNYAGTENSVTAMANQANSIENRIAAVEEEINGLLKTAPSEDKVGLEGQKSALEGYKNNLNTLKGKITKYQTVLSDNKIDIKDATIKLGEIKFGPNGQDPSPSVNRVIYNGTALTDGVDYEFTTKPDSEKYHYTRNSDGIVTAGSVTISGKGQYYGNATVNYTVSDIKPSGSVMVDTDVFMDDVSGEIHNQDGTGTGVYVEPEMNPKGVNSLLRDSVTNAIKDDSEMAPSENNVYAKIVVGEASATDKAEIEKKLKQMSDASKHKYSIVGKPYDIKIQAVNVNGKTENVPETEGIIFTVDVPNGYESGASITTVRLHNGEAVDLKTLGDDYTGVITNGSGKIIKAWFKGDQFSAYAIVYESTGGTYNITIPSDEYDYTGKPITPPVTVKYKPSSGAEQTLELDKDYTVTYTKNVNPGLATVLVTSTGTYPDFPTKEKDREVYFAVKGTIPSGDITKVSAMLSGASSYTYTGKEIKPAVQVYDQGVQLSPGSQYNVTYQNNVDAGTASAIVQGINSYAGYRQELGFTIMPKDIGSSGVSISDVDDKEIEEGGTATQKLKIKYNGMTLSKGKDYTLTYTDNKKAGTATVTIDGQGNYTGSVEEDFEVEVKSKSSSSSSASSSMAPAAGLNPNGTPNIQPTIDSRAANGGAAGGSPKTNDTRAPLMFIAFGFIAVAAIGLLVSEKKDGKFGKKK